MRANSNFLASSVVARTRLGWILIAILLVAVVWTSVKDLKDLQRTQKALGEQVIPAMAQVAHITHSLPELRAALAEWGAAQDLGTHTALTRRAMGAVEALAEGLPATSAFVQIEDDLRASVAELDRLGKAGLEPSLTNAPVPEIAGLQSEGAAGGGLKIAELRRLEFAKVDDLLNRAEAVAAVSAAFAKDRMGEAVQRLDDRIATTITRFLVLAGAVFAVAGGLFLIVERQVIHRLGKLMHAVGQLASGKEGWDVNVAGADELGEMSAVLKAVHEQSNELRRSNEELGRFAYTASHDLKSPLRAIHDLAEWTIEDEGEALSDGGRRKLGLLLHRAQRLNNLLDSLIAFSRVGRWRSGVKRVDLHWMVQDILDLLGAGDRFTLNTVGAFKHVRTFEVPLRQVLQNFIDNAVKHHDRERGEITVSFQRDGDRLYISVTDDGPGIAPEFHAKVFELFKTLQSRDKVEGSGMGLAIIRKQVEQYGGTLTVISDPATQRGTRFSFDWPLNEGCGQIDQAA